MEPHNTYYELVRVLRAKMRTAGGVMKVLSAAKLPKDTVNHAADPRRKEPLRILPFLQVLKTLDLSPVAFFREVMAQPAPGDADSVPGFSLPASYQEARNSCRDPFEVFLLDASPPPVEFRLAWEGFDEPIPPSAQARLDEVENLRAENPQEAAELARPLVESANLNVSLRAAVLWGSCLRLSLQVDDNLRKAQAIVSEALKIARCKGMPHAEASLWYQAAYIVADRGTSEGYAAALCLVERAALLFLDCADTDGVARAQIGKSLFLMYGGHTKASECVCRAILDLPAAPYLKAVAVFNLAYASISIRRPDRARQLVKEAAEKLRQAGANRYDMGRLHWLEGRLAHDNVEASEHHYREALELLEPLEADRVLICLELSRLYRRHGRLIKALQLAETACKVALPIASQSVLVDQVRMQALSEIAVGRLSGRLLATFRKVIGTSRIGRAVTQYSTARPQ